MDKIFAFFVVLILFISGFGVIADSECTRENILSETILFSKPKIIEKDDFISIDIPESNSNYWETDKPLLPVINKVFEFEFGTKIDSVEVAFSDPVAQKLSKYIEPTPKDQILSSINTQKYTKGYGESK